jgi:hypothetical protein
VILDTAAVAPDSIQTPWSVRVTMHVALSLVVCSICLACPTPAAAHRLDEYLQATRIAVGLDVVDVELDLTAGASVASTVFASIDSDGDGRLSQMECASYATLVATSAVLEADGRRAPLVVTSSQCPTLDDMSAGVGTIRLTARADVARSAGRHQLYFQNIHRADLGAYLVNALLPATNDVVVTGQRRDERQHELRLDYMSAGRGWALSWEQLGWLGVATLLAGVLGRSRLRVSAPARARETSLSS